MIRCIRQPPSSPSPIFPLAMTILSPAHRRRGRRGRRGRRARSRSRDGARSGARWRDGCAACTARP
eukprot:scaffold85130_cov78-Phaeocystis_antarctica.AAC.1